MIKTSTTREAAISTIKLENDEHQNARPRNTGENGATNENMPNLYNQADECVDTNLHTAKLQLGEGEHGQYEIFELSPGGVVAWDELPSQVASGKRRTFILRQSKEAQKRAQKARFVGDNNDFADRYDYEKKYPADEPKNAMNETARVWRVYLDEAGQYDVDMTENFKDTVDVILVFAGLFSAVVTTFVVQSSTALRTDYVQVIASILNEQLAIQRAYATGSPIPDPQTSTLSLDSSTTAVSDRWVNGLWFTSLAFSLSTALIAVLVKQWIQAYLSPVSGTSRLQARLRQYRFMGLEKWHVPLIVGLLPTLLHLSLLLFLMGLVVYLLGLDRGIAISVSSITALSYLAYLVSNILPLFNPQCPYKTSISALTYAIIHSFIFFVWRWSFWPLKELIMGIRWRARLEWLIWRHPGLRASSGAERSNFREMVRRERTRLVSHRAEPKLGTMKDGELADIDAQGEKIDVMALRLLSHASNHPSVKNIVIQALGSPGMSFEGERMLLEEGLQRLVCSTLRQLYSEDIILSNTNDNHLLQCVQAHNRCGWDTVKILLESPSWDTPCDTSSCFCTCNILSLSQTIATAANAASEVTAEPYRNFPHLPVPQTLQTHWDGILASMPAPLLSLVSVQRLADTAACLRAASRSRASNYERYYHNWPACHALFKLIDPGFPSPLYPESLRRDSLLSNMQRSIIPVYLASPLSKDEPKAVTDLLLSRGILTSDDDFYREKSTLYRLISIGCSATFLYGALQHLQLAANKIELTWWDQIRQCVQFLVRDVRTIDWSALVDVRTELEYSDVVQWVFSCMDRLLIALLKCCVESLAAANTNSTGISAYLSESVEALELISQSDVSTRLPLYLDIMRLVMGNPHHSVDEVTASSLAELTKKGSPDSKTLRILLSLASRCEEKTHFLSQISDAVEYVFGLRVLRSAASLHFHILDAFRNMDGLSALESAFHRSNQFPSRDSDSCTRDSTRYLLAQCASTYVQQVLRKDFSQEDRKWLEWHTREDYYGSHVAYIFDHLTPLCSLFYAMVSDSTSGHDYPELRKLASSRPTDPAWDEAIDHFQSQLPISITDGKGSSIARFIETLQEILAEERSDVPSRAPLPSIDDSINERWT